MKNRSLNLITFTPGLYLFLLVMLPALSLGQKLPNVQEVSLRAPAQVKIDGNATEWNNQYQAYNKAVDVFYTVANDDENLYLLVKAEKPRIINKIIGVGVTFIVNKTGKKADDKNSAVLTCPVLDVAPGQRALWYAGAKTRSAVEIPKAIADRDTTQFSSTHTDSSIVVANNILSNNSKNIKVKGLNGITESTISVYNEERIKAIAKFDKGGALVYELAIPLKYLALNITEPQKFNYSIRLESRLTEPKHGMRTTYIYPNGIMTDVDQDLDSTTDLWSNYTLTTK